MLSVMLFPVYIATDEKIGWVCERPVRAPKPVALGEIMRLELLP